MTHISLFYKWVEEFSLINVPFLACVSFEDTIILSFKGTPSELYLHYGQQSVIFCAEKHSDVVREANLHHQPSALSQKIEKLLAHAKLNECQILQDDKIIMLTFTKYNIYNQKEEYILLFEMISRYQNIILAKREKEKIVIVDCLKKITFADTSTRQILPGSEYVPPKTEYIHTPKSISYPFIADDIEFDCINDFFIHTFFVKELTQKKMHQKKAISRSIEKEIKKNTLKLEKQNIELESANEMEHWHQCVELLRSEIHTIVPGMSKIVLKNYFFDGFPDIEIPLNPVFSPQKNLDFYVKKYKKAVSGQKIITKNIAETKQKIIQAQNQLSRIENIDDYQELKSYQQNNTTQKNTSVKKLFRILPISDEWEIMIGRTSKENDILTCKTATPNDWWFHTRIFHGTHVVLRNYRKKAPPDTLIVLCCRLAAHYSCAKNSVNVPVDYTQIRFVRKPRGATPGFVTYKNHKTYYADPLSMREAMPLVEKLDL
jgi:predicted ribosome quality control (RQC) complex YloA/Tae2 family protein